MRALALLALLLAWPAQAQAPSPAQMGITQTSPQVLETLDSSKRWVPLGTTSGGVFSGLGSEINLRSFGAKCDGATVDTTAIQNWLNTAGPNVKLTAPAGVCLFDQPLTIGTVGNYAIRGSGQYATTFSYVGTSTTAALLTINPANAASVSGITIGDLRIASQTTMTGGYAIQANGVYEAVFDKITLDGANLVGQTGKLCGGVWLNGASGVTFFNPDFWSVQNCGDALTINASPLATGAAEVLVFGGSMGGYRVAGTSGTINGFTNGVHIAGGFGGFRCDNLNLHNNGVNLLVDNANYAATNREVVIGSTCVLDTPGSDNIWLNDTLSSGAYLVVHGNINSAAGHGVRIQKWPSGYALFQGGRIYNNCGSGVFVQDVTTNVVFSQGVAVYGNGTTQGPSTLCTSWQTANPGHGYGVDAQAGSSSIFGNVTASGNAAGPWNANSHLAGPAVTSNGGTFTSQTIKDIWGSNAYLILDTTATNKGVAAQFRSNSVPQWQIGTVGTQQFTIQDTVASAANWLTVSTGGNATIGDSASSVLTVKGPIVVQALPTSAGSGGLYVCVDSTGAFYKKAACP